MSQTWNVPLAGGTTFNAAAGEWDSALESLRTNHSGSSVPASVVNGMWFNDTTLDKMSVRVSGAFVVILPDTTIAGGGLLQLAGGTLSGDLDLGSNQVTNLGDGSDAGDGVTLSQVEGMPQMATVFLGDISATKDYPLAGLPNAGTNDMDIVSVKMVCTVSIALDAVDYWEMQVRNHTQSNDLILVVKSTDSGAASNKEAITLKVVWNLNIDQNKTSLAADDVLILEVVKVAAATTITDATMIVEYLSRT